MSFPPGKPILLLLVIALASGLLLAARPKKVDDSLHIWLFAQSHVDALCESIDEKPSLVEQWESATGQSVSVELVGSRALNTRLESLLQSGATGSKLPDLVAIEINSVGQFLRQPPELIAFHPINDWIEQDNLRHEFVEARLAPWTRDGQIFGIPQDVHPTTLTYRKDLFVEAGIDLESIETWDAFAEAGRRYRKFWRDRGKPERLAFELSTSTSGDLVTLLLQRGVNLVDDELDVHLTDPIVIDTIARYARWVAGSDRFAGPSSAGGDSWCKDVERGDIGAVLTPDWRIEPLRTTSPALSGSVAMRQLPKFESSDSPTSTIGGTMIAIPRNARDPKQAWELAKFMFLSPQAMSAREKFSGIIPPLRSAWNSPAWQQPDPFFAGQHVNRMMIQLADQIPNRLVTSYSTLAGASLTPVLIDAMKQVESGADEISLRERIRMNLQSAQEDMERAIEFSRLDRTGSAKAVR